jgi:hypothetical protein
MLRLFFGVKSDCLYSGDGYFDNWIDSGVVLTDFGRKVIRNIDKCEVKDKNLIISPIIGAITPSQLSGGTKVLLTLSVEDKVFDLSALGENCYPYLAELCRVKDISMTADSFKALYSYAEFGSIYIENTNTVVNSSEALCDEYFKCRS